MVIGWLAALLGLLLRRRISNPTVSTVLSFTLPFLASIPAELLGASGLVAAVVAGIVTGIRAPRDLTPQTRLSDAQNWRTVELVLEGAVFLTMGIQITSILADVEREHAGIGLAVLIAAGALLITLLVRALYVGPLLAVLSWRSKRLARVKDRVQGMQERITSPEGAQETFAEVNHRRRPRSERDLQRFVSRVTQVVADVEYFLRAPLGWREGTAVVWAGMRGAVTVAAAQTLPEGTPQRPVLVLMAFAVAVLSLLVQGGTIGPLLKRIAPQTDKAAVARQADEERSRLFELMRTSGESIERPPVDGERSAESFERAKQYQLDLIAAQRAALLDARDNGTFDADVLETALANLDASQIAIEMRATMAE